MSVKLDSLEIKKIKEQYGEAFYILDSEQFRKNFLELKDSFASIYPNFNIAYSYKTNYTPKLCKIVNELGGYAEVVSEMEMELAVRIGVRPQNIIWNGPIKNLQVVEEFLMRGGVVNIDSLEELEILKTIIPEHPKRTFNLGIRCNFDVNDGVVSRFGFDIDGEEFSEAISFLSYTPNVRFINLQCHFAKRQIDFWPSRAKKMVALLDRISIIPDRIDLGGGLFGKMADFLKIQFGSIIPSYSDYARVTASVFADRFGFSGPELIIEPGSALVGDCMKFIGTVKTIKCVRGKYFATMLGSRNNINMNGVTPPIEVIPSGNIQKEYDKIDIVGYTCIESDVLFKDFSGKIAVEDSVVISNCGSYSLVMKPPFILPNFPVLDLSGGNIEVLKRSESFEDIFHTYLI